MPLRDGASRGPPRGAGEAREEAVLDATVIQVAAYDRAFLIDPIERRKRTPGKVIGNVSVRRDKDEPMSESRTVGESAYDGVIVVVPEDNGPGRSRGIDRRHDGAIAIAIVTVRDAIDIDVITRRLVRAINLISQSHRGVWDGELRHDSADADETGLHPAGRDVGAAEVVRIVEPEDNRKGRTGHVVIIEGGPAREKAVRKTGACVRIIATDHEGAVNSPALRGIPRTRWIHERGAVVPVRETDKRARRSDGIDNHPDDAVLVADFLRLG